MVVLCVFCHWISLVYAVGPYPCKSVSRIVWKSTKTWVSAVYYAAFYCCYSILQSIQTVLLLRPFPPSEVYKKYADFFLSLLLLKLGYCNSAYTWHLWSQELSCSWGGCILLHSWSSEKLGWVSLGEKLGEKHMSVVMKHNCQKLESFGYIFIEALLV